jgi:hypothetical protein
MAHGFHQEHRTFAPVAPMTIVPARLVVASVCHCYVSQLDVKNVFLNG